MVNKVRSISLLHVMNRELMRHAVTGEEGGCFVFLMCVFLASWRTSFSTAFASSCVRFTAISIALFDRSHALEPYFRRSSRLRSCSTCIAYCVSASSMDTCTLCFVVLGVICDEEEGATGMRRTVTGE